MVPADAQVMDDRTIVSEDGPHAGDALVDDRGVSDVVTAEDRSSALDSGGPDGALTDAVVAVDQPPIDAGADAGAMDVPRADSGALDVPSARDVVDAGDSRPSTDVVPTDVPRDVPPADVARDVPPADVARDVPPADVARDVARDVPPADVPGCTGAAPVVTVSAPTSGATIETCSAAGLPVYFDFTAAVTASAPLRSMGARWITPDGLEAPPPASLSAAPYVFRRQVGGPSSGTPALSVFGIRGDWRVEFTATDSCGRSTTASQTFSLIFTTRRCPNP